MYDSTVEVRADLKRVDKVAITIFSIVGYLFT